MGISMEMFDFQTKAETLPVSTVVFHKRADPFCSSFCFFCGMSCWLRRSVPLAKAVPRWRSPCNLTVWSPVGNPGHWGAQEHTRHGTRRGDPCGAPQHLVLIRNCHYLEPAFSQHKSVLFCFVFRAKETFFIKMFHENAKYEFSINNSLDTFFSPIS